MTALSVTGWDVLCPGGDGADQLAKTVATGPEPAGADDLAHLADQGMPAGPAYAVANFDIRARLGRKGTSAYDRLTGLAVVACGRALEDRGLTVTDENRQRVGVVLGTTAGSIRSTVDFCAETWLQDRPYLVNPSLFPNTVMNAAASQVAIRYGLRGPNTTVAGGPIAFLHTLRYADRVLRAGYADVLLAGAVEELTMHSSLAVTLGVRGPARAPVPGEGAAVFVVERTNALPAGRGDAEVLSVALGFGPGGSSRTALARCITRALAEAGVTPADLWLVVTGGDGAAAFAGEDIETQAVEATLGSPAPRCLVASAIHGACLAALGGLQLATLLALHRGEGGDDGAVALLTGCSPEGSVGAAVIRARSRGCADRR